MKFKSDPFGIEEFWCILGATAFYLVVVPFFLFALTHIDRWTDPNWKSGEPDFHSMTHHDR